MIKGTIEKVDVLNLESDFNLLEEVHEIEFEEMPKLEERFYVIEKGRVIWSWSTSSIRAMEVIESLEPTRRHLYTGCIGYFGFDGNSDFNIVIRTIMKQKDKVYINVGGGITWESDPKAEYQETLDKAAALFRAVRTQEK